MSFRRIYAWTVAPFIVLAPCQSFADAAVADASIRCSGLFYILTSLPHNPTAKYVGIVMGDVFKIHQSEAAGRGLSNSDMFQARDDAAIELGKMYDEAPADVVELYLQCNQWSRQVAKYLYDSGIFAADNSLNERDAKRIVLAAPGFPEPVTVPSSDRQEIEQEIARAFQLWTDNNRATRQSALDIILNEVETQEEEARSEK